LASLFRRSNVSNVMSLDPKDLWATLPPVLQCRTVNDIAAVLAGMSREVRTVKPAHLARKAVVYIRQSTRQNAQLLRTSAVQS
jgi:hypothetical protein